MRIQFIQDLYDKFRGKKKYNLKEIFEIQKNLYIKIEKLKEKRVNGKKISVAFLHMYASSCQTLSIFENMLNSDCFDPYFIVNPDIARSNENIKNQYNKTKDQLILKYGNDRVLDGYNLSTNEFIDYSNRFDIMTTNNPYDHMANEYFKISYWAEKRIPIFYIPYFYMGRCYVTIDNLKLQSFNYFWKVFVENNYVLKLAKKYQQIKGKNIIVAGAPKMDELCKLNKTSENQEKIVLISPHHQIGESDTAVGGFLNYFSYIDDLVKRYKNVKFIFRPHPLLFVNLYENNFWSKEEIEKWLYNFISNDNVEYSTQGDYMDLFAKSDALIHDCGSYMCEYLYTHKPVAFMLRDSLNIKKTFTKFGRNVLNVHYKMKTKEELFDFMDNVVLLHNDNKKSERLAFAEKEVMVNYPNATNFIMKKLEETFK